MKKGIVKTIPTSDLDSSLASSKYLERYSRKIKKLFEIQDPIAIMNRLPIELSLPSLT